MYELLDSLHKKILRSTFVEEVSEAEILALVKAKETFKKKSDVKIKKINKDSKGK